MRQFFKKTERIGRQWLIRLLALLFGVRSKSLTLPASPRILVVRLDERVGNLILLTPLLSSLRQRFPNPQVALLANIKGKVLLENHPAINTIHLFDKRKYFGKQSPWGVIRKVRREHYDLAIDAGNPIGPSTTQTIVVWISGALHTLGVKRPDDAQLFSQVVNISDPDAHEIDLRLELLKALPGQGSTRQVSLTLPEQNSEIDSYLKKIPERFVVLNIGARLIQKQLTADEYKEVVFAIQESGFVPVLSYGPAEEPLAKEIASPSDSPLAPPPTDLLALSYLMSKASAVVTCDTGPMHLAVAMQTPTFGIFVSTSPKRFGYSHPPHFALDAQAGWKKEFQNEIRQWLRSPLDHDATLAQR